ncbi:hypothetical protein E2562_032899 [Oryza meyeriana var. granulata]|uniref:Uncharacterized protein n=1 Tax=Oryza meyeriana var. granulata TaxID=110450 RepID=A0A6G1F0X6_9ORYZ|nr:hypothetical protein E2562_032899 [Oryza meyeriana var. granulata]
MKLSGITFMNHLNANFINNIKQARRKHFGDGDEIIPKRLGCGLMASAMRRPRVWVDGVGDKNSKLGLKKRVAWKTGPCDIERWSRRLH